MRSLLPVVALLAACGRAPTEVGDFKIEIVNDGAGLTIEHELLGVVLEDVRPVVGVGSADLEMQFGAFRFNDEVKTFGEGLRFSAVRGKRTGIPLIELVDATGAYAGSVQFSAIGDDLVMDWSPANPPTSDSDANMVRTLAGWSAKCDTDDHFMGLGAHAQDIDHVGEAFHLWVQEPGIGKSDNDEIPPAWPLEGAKHDTSFPVPAFVRPHRGQGIVLETASRVDVDLCATDPNRFEVVVWDEGNQRTVLLPRLSALGATRAVARHSGLLTLPPAWAFGPWNDAIRGEERVNEVADTLRDSGASSTAIWTEDWKGGEENINGYHLLGEWSISEELYPSAADQAAELEANGFQWLAYFSPFLMEDTDAWQEAIDDGVILTDGSGEPVVFPGATFKDTSMVDLSTVAGRQWAIDRMHAALDLGFDGWMADFAEWLPPEAVLGAQGNSVDLHNAYPLWWQETNRDAMEGRDGVFWVRSGWLGTSGLVPAVWAGDQRTSFDLDDGFPTVLSMGLGLAASGVPVFTHDIAGYQSVGNPTTDKELWFRWASLGAWSPIMRTHHGAFDTENWQFDSDVETQEHWAAVTREHARLFPYRYGLAAQAAQDGTPMLLPTSYVYGGEWGRQDAWLLGKDMLVAPVLERGVTGREVTLPDTTTWYHWSDHTPASSGFVEADLTEIPVFAAAGAVIPTFDLIPDTFLTSDVVTADLVTLDEADAQRTIYVFGGEGSFTEADGTTYTALGEATTAGEATAPAFTIGNLSAGGITLEVTGPVERVYTLVVVP